MRKWFVLGILSIALFLIVVDVTVLYTALPTLTRELHASASARLWIVNAYPLVVAGLLPGLGTLGDRLGHRRFFIIGLYVFGAASLCAAYAPSAGMLIAARVFLALGAATMMPATLSIIRLTFDDEHERSVAIGCWAATASCAGALGPIIGGALLSHFWWGSVFLINVPVVLIAIPLAFRFIRPNPPQPDKVWDAWGSGQILVGLVGLTYAIKELGKPHTRYGTAALALAIGSFALWRFIQRQRKRPDPLIDLKLFENRLFALSVLTAVTSAAALFSMELVFVQRMQLVSGLSPLNAAFFILPIAIASFCAGPLTGWAMSFIGAARTLWMSLLLASAAMGAYMFAYNAATISQVACLMMLGLGIGAAITASSSTIMHSAAAEHAGMSASIEEVSFELGGAFGVTLMGSLLSFIYARMLSVTSLGRLPSQARDSLDDALEIAKTLPKTDADILTNAARSAFDTGFVWVLGACSLLLALMAVTILLSGNRIRMQAALSASPALQQKRPA